MGCRRRTALIDSAVVAVVVAAVVAADVAAADLGSVVVLARAG